MILVLEGYSSGNTYSCTVPDDCSPETNIAPATGGWKRNSLFDGLCSGVMIVVGYFRGCMYSTEYFSNHRYHGMN